MTQPPTRPDEQRLKEAVWRIQGLVRRGRLSQQRARMVDQELWLLAEALGVPTLDADPRCPLCGHPSTPQPNREGGGE